MTETYRHTKICEQCKQEFKTFIGEYTICCYCWYENNWGKISRFFNNYRRKDA